MEAGVVTRIAEIAQGRTDTYRVGPEQVLVHNGTIIAREVVEYQLPTPLVVHTLTGLRHYLQANRDFLAIGDVAVHVASPTRVDVLGKLLSTAQRSVHLRAECYDRFAAVPGFRFNTPLPHESMVVGLWALFESTPHQRDLLQLLSNVEQGDVRTDEDDGISQKVTVRTGISMVADRRVPNPVNLAPFRTFTEISQPYSKFIFRMKKGDGTQASVALYEADGGAWRDEAVAAIRDYLTAEISDGTMPSVAVLA